MYTSFFGLNEKPFAITPNPRYLYMSEKHAEALAHLMYGLNEAGGFIQLTGEVGTGKTTMVRTLLEQLPQHAEVALVLNPRLTSAEFLLTICEELGLFLRNESVHSLKNLVDELNSHLLNAHAKGRRVVVIVDEAQNLLPETLEQVRLLTNLETTTHKLLQIILIGQPELRELLARNDLRQLAQRITGRYHLAPLDHDNTTAYIRHRLQVSGAVRELFTDQALTEVFRLSRGVPRLINIICDRALLGAYTQNQPQVEASTVRQAAREITDVTMPMGRRALWISALSLVTLLAIGSVVWRLTQTAPQTPISSIAAATTDNTAASSATSNAAIASKTDAAILDTTQVLQDIGVNASSDVAFAALFNLWGLPYDASTRACDQAGAQALACVYQKGSWNLLRSLNRPAILQLSDEQGAAYQVVISGLSDGTAQLLVNAQPHTVTLASLSRYWTGDFLLLWRPKVSTDKPLLTGMQGEDVNWLRRSLANWRADPEPTQADTDRYDTALATQVSEFQRAQQLAVDGIAGEQTQIALDAAVSAHDEPVLHTHTPHEAGHS